MNKQQWIDKIEDSLIEALGFIEDFKSYYWDDESDLYIMNQIEDRINSARDTLLYEGEDENE